MARSACSLLVSPSNREPPSRLRSSLRSECLGLRLTFGGTVGGQGPPPLAAVKASPPPLRSGPAGDRRDPAFVARVGPGSLALGCHAEPCGAVSDCALLA